MKLICCSFEEMKQRILSKRSKIIMFGAGVIGRISCPGILEKHNILDEVDCYIDNNEKLWGEDICVFQRRFTIRSPEYLRRYSSNVTVLINISRYANVLSQLENLNNLCKADCYIMPMMLIHNYCSHRSKGYGNFSEKAQIPKKLHYMWLGRTEIKDNLKRCIDSWKKYCPDYEIIEWNEKNYDINKHPYMKRAYECGAYGFVPDYARLDILYNEGGFYLDTDVELLNNIDYLRNQMAFCGVEKWQTLNFGGLSGAIKGHKMIKSFLEERADISFINPDGSQNRNTCGYYDTQVALKNGYQLNGETQNINQMNIFAYDYFHPYDYMSGIFKKTDNTYSVHWFNGGWLDENMKKINEESKNQYLKLYKEALQMASY